MGSGGAFYPLRLSLRLFLARIAQRGSGVNAALRSVAQRLKAELQAALAQIHVERRQNR